MSAKDIIQLQDVTYLLLHSFLQFIYTGRTRVIRVKTWLKLCLLGPLKTFYMNTRVTPSIFTQVNVIPHSFSSLGEYLSSFVYPLIEETRSELFSKVESLSTAPFAKIITCCPSERFIERHYEMVFDNWTESSDSRSKVPHETKSGDLIVFTQAKPDKKFTVRRLLRSWFLGYVTIKKMPRHEFNERLICRPHFEVSTSIELKAALDVSKPFYAVFLMNMTTNNRIWHALRTCPSDHVIKELVRINPTVHEDCKNCPATKETPEEKLSLTSYLNKSQYEFVPEAINSFGNVVVLYQRQVSGKIFKKAFRDRNILFKIHGVAFYNNVIATHLPSTPLTAKI